MPKAPSPSELWHALIVVRRDRYFFDVRFGDLLDVFEGDFLDDVLADFFDDFFDDFLAPFLPPFFGAFAPFLRASESPMAIACLRLVTFFPLPLFRVPRFFLRMAFFTLFPAPFEYFAIVFSLYA